MKEEEGEDPRHHHFHRHHWEEVHRRILRLLMVLTGGRIRHHLRHLVGAAGATGLSHRRLGRHGLKGLGPLIAWGYHHSYVAQVHF